jgi:hypothetical protein
MNSAVVDVDLTCGGCACSRSGRTLTGLLDLSGDAGLESVDGSLKVVASVRVRLAIDLEYLLPVRVDVGNVELDCLGISSKASASGSVIFLRGDSRRGTFAHYR